MKREWIVVKGGGVAGLREAEDKKSETKVWKERSERWVHELKGWIIESKDET